MKARELIADGETAVAVYTDGLFLEIKPDGTGSTGNWIVRSDLDVDRVIILRRGASQVNQVYVATFNGLTLDEGDPRRWRIHFTNARLVGRTDNNWREFADAGQNPVRYVP